MKFTSVFRANAKFKRRFVVNPGGTGSSKTWSILQILYLLATRIDGLHISIVSENLPHLKRGAMRDFFKMLKAEGLYNVRYHNKSDHIYTIGTSIIEFFGADDDSKLRGARRDILFINECNNISYEAYLELEIRTNLRIYLDYNPVQEFWIHDKVIPLPETDYIESTYLDNEYLNPNIVKSIESKEFTDPNWWNVYGLGKVGSLDGVIITNWAMCDEFPHFEDCKWVAYGQDFGFTNDPSVLVRVALSRGELWAEELMYETNLTNPDISDLYPNYGLGPIDEIICDSDPKDVKELRNLGWNTRAVKKVTGGESGSIVYGLKIIKQYKLNIVKSSVNGIKEVRNYQWKKDPHNTGKFLNVPIDLWNHFMDALRYVCMEKIGRGTIKPARASVPRRSRG